MRTNANDPVPQALTDVVESFKLALLNYAATGHEEGWCAVGVSMFVRGWLFDFETAITGERHFAATPDDIIAHLQRIRDAEESAARAKAKRKDGR